MWVALVGVVVRVRMCVSTYAHVTIYGLHGCTSMFEVRLFGQFHSVVFLTLKDLTKEMELIKKTREQRLVNNYMSKGGGCGSSGGAGAYVPTEARILGALYLTNSRDAVMYQNQPGRSRSLAADYCGGQSTRERSSAVDYSGDGVVSEDKSDHSSSSSTTDGGGCSSSAFGSHEIPGHEISEAEMIGVSKIIASESVHAWCMEVKAIQEFLETTRPCYLLCLLWYLLGHSCLALIATTCLPLLLGAIIPLCGYSLVPSLCDCLRYLFLPLVVIKTRLTGTGQ